MNSTLRKGMQAAAIACLFLAYSVLAHFSTATSLATTHPGLGVAVSLAPALIILLILSWRSSKRWIMFLICIGVAALLWRNWTQLEQNFNWVYFLQHVGTNLMLAAVFGMSLSFGKQPLCSRLAETVHGNLSDDLIRYTRQVTVAWTLFFLAISLVSSLLFWLAPIETWSIFANFLSFPLIVSMFVVEYLVRLRKLPNLQNHGFMSSINAYRNSTTHSATTSATVRDVVSNPR